MVGPQIVSIVLIASLLVSSLGSPLGCYDSACKGKKQIAVGVGLAEVIAGLLEGTGGTAALIGAGATGAAAGAAINSATHSGKSNPSPIIQAV